MMAVFNAYLDPLGRGRKPEISPEGRWLLTRRDSQAAGLAGDQSCAPDFLITHERFTWVFQ
jgi:hypothetical protein